MSDWSVGDLAVCVERPSPNKFGALAGFPEPVVGGVYMVEGLGADYFGNLGLILEGHPSNHPCGPAWLASRFRKVTPDKHEACETEFVTLLKRSRKTVSA